MYWEKKKKEYASISYGRKKEAIGNIYTRRTLPLRNIVEKWLH